MYIVILFEFTILPFGDRILGITNWGVGVLSYHIHVSDIPASVHYMTDIAYVSNSLPH